MSDIKKIKNYRSFRQKKIVETLEEKQRRHDDFVKKLESIADEVLDGKHKNKPALTADELAEMKRQKPEIFEMVDSLLTVAERVNALPDSPKIVPVAVPVVENDTLPVSDALTAPALGEAVENLSTLIRGKKFQSRF